MRGVLLDLRTLYKPENIEKLYCSKLNTHIKVCRMDSCSLFEECKLIMAQIQLEHSQDM